MLHRLIYSARGFHMKKWIVIAALLCVGLCSVAATKGGVKQQTGILIVSPFYFLIQGDGISTTLTLNPLDIPQNYPYGPAFPHLQPVGTTGTGACGNYLFTSSLSGHQVALTFTTPPPEGIEENCVVNLLFQPQ